MAAESAQSLTAEGWLPFLLRWQPLTQSYAPPSFLLTSIFVTVPWCPGPEDHSGPFLFFFFFLSYNILVLGVGQGSEMQLLTMLTLTWTMTPERPIPANLTTPNS